MNIIYINSEKKAIDLAGYRYWLMLVMFDLILFGRFTG
jgi:hypothetical protein